jgi:ribose transport system substrate-binding protein
LKAWDRKGKPASHSSWPYTVKSVVRALDVLRVFHAGDALRLRDVVRRTGFRKGMCFRLLYTLRQCGFIERAGSDYRLAHERRRRTRYRIGYTDEGDDSYFPRAVRSGLVQAASRERVDLIPVAGRSQPGVALQNAEHLIREGIDLVIEFQPGGDIAPAIASKYIGVGIPMIAIDRPHAGATYFGADNHEAGVLAGRCLGQAARAHPSGRVDEILLLEDGRAGPLLQARMRGALAGIKDVLREAEFVPVVSLDGAGQFQTSLDCVRKHLHESKAGRVLVAAANDASALGATRAFREAGRAGGCAIVGQNAEPEARAELREPGTPLIATVGHFPEHYGDRLMRLALDILSKRCVPPAVFVRHQLVTRHNVDDLYPQDGPGVIES